MTRPITGRTRVAAVIGDPVAHSLSPAIHNAAFAATGLDWVFVALTVAPGAVGEALVGARALGLGGLSVTMPHKEAVLDHLDEVDEAALALRAVNCIVVEGDRLLGTNTDGEGFLAALRAEGVEPAGRRVLVLGAGGAGRAVVRALGGAGVAELGVANRSSGRREEAVALGGEAARTADPDEAPGFDVVVNATPVGMGSDEPALDPARLRAGQVVVDLVYDPVDTALLRAARAAGATAVDGVGMLVHQAARAFRHWTGQDPPLSVMNGAARAALAAKA